MRRSLLYVPLIFAPLLLVPEVTELSYRFQGVDFRPSPRLRETRQPPANMGKLLAPLPAIDPAAVKRARLRRRHEQIAEWTRLRAKHEARVKMAVIQDAELTRDYGSGPFETVWYDWGLGVTVTATQRRDERLWGELVDFVKEKFNRDTSLDRIAAFNSPYGPPGPMPLQ